MDNIKVLESLISVLKTLPVASDEDKIVLSGLKRIINERWITIHPHGEDSDDYRRLKLEDGESPKEAIDRVYKKEDKSDKLKQTVRSGVFDRFSKLQYYEKMDRLTSKLWDDYATKLRKVEIYWDDTEEVQAQKREEIESYHKKYKDAQTERTQLAKEINQLQSEIKDNVKKALEKYKVNNIDSKIKDADISETTKKIEDVLQKFDYKKLVNKYDEVHEKFSNEKDKWLDYMNAGKDNEEKLQREQEYTNWFNNSDLRKERDELSSKIISFDKDRRKAISEALKIKDGAEFNIQVNKKSVLYNKTQETNELLTGIVNKKYLPNFNPEAKGRSGRACQSGNYLRLEGDDTVVTHIHEAMHWLELVNPDMLANSKAFLEYRTKDETAEKLRKITSNKSYTSDEISKKDNFFSPYCGKQYDDATEIMSMGVQRLFEHPDDFIKTDREYFDFVIANLQGKL